MPSQKDVRPIRSLAFLLAFLVLALWVGVAGLLMVPSARADEPKLDSEIYLIPSADPGIQLYIRNKHPAGVTSFTPDKILLYVHGATYPAETSFDLPLGGRSMMDYVAQHGFDVYLVDVRGYGGSTKPSEMDAPPAENKPIVDTPTAARDVGAAVDHILQKRGVGKIDLMGWSWGTAIMGLYTTTHNDKVNRLVLYAPAWTVTTRPAIGGGETPLGAYRTVSKDSAKQRWLNGVPEAKKADLIPDGWFEQWADATWALDAAGAKQTPPVLRAPNGVLQDFRTYWIAGKPQYDPADIRVPTVLIHAEWESDQAPGYFAKLTSAPYKRYIEIGEGTHSIMMEKNRMQFFREIINFLDERDPQSMN
jgi:pimeloyl-ACP methyl ester carboxylesterase